MGDHVAFTYYTGFKVNSGEYQVMGLAPYGEPPPLPPSSTPFSDDALVSQSR